MLFSDSINCNRTASANSPWSSFNISSFNLSLLNQELFINSLMSVGFKGCYSLVAVVGLGALVTSIRAVVLASLLK